MLAARSFAELVSSVRKAEASHGSPFVSRRAAIVALLGPAVFTWGFLWTVGALVLTPVDFYWRSIVFSPAHQLMFAGAVISLICLPVAREMSEASPEELAVPDFEAAHRANKAALAERRPSYRRRKP